jgi:MFS family permease
MGPAGPRAGPEGGPPEGRPARPRAGAPRPAWLTRGVAGIGLASFLSDLGHEVPTALLPTLLVGILGAPAAALGLVEGAADALAGVAKLIGGALADDPRRRRMTAVASYAATAILSGLIGVVGVAWQAGVLRAGAWTARGLRTPARNALLAEAAPPSAYGRAYGLERALDNFGAIVGPLLAIGLVGAFGVRAAILASALPGLLAAVAILDAARSAPPPRARPPRTGFVLGQRARGVFRGSLGRAMRAMAAFELGNVAATLLILRVSELLVPAGGLRVASAVAIGLYAAHNAAATLASFPAGRLADRRGPMTALGLGVTLFLLAYLGFAVGGRTALVPGTALVLAGLGIGCVETAEHAAVARLASGELRGSAFGVLGALQSLGNLAASGAVGLIWSVLSPGAAFAWPAAWMGVSLALVVRAARRG